MQLRGAGFAGKLVNLSFKNCSSSSIYLIALVFSNVYFMKNCHGFLSVARRNVTRSGHCLKNNTSHAPECTRVSRKLSECPEVNSLSVLYIIITTQYSSAIVSSSHATVSL